MGFFDLVKSTPGKLKAGRQSIVKHEQERRASEVSKAKSRLKRRKEDALIRKSKSPPKGYGILGIKKKKQTKTLSRKSRIRLI